MEAKLLGEDPDREGNDCGLTDDDEAETSELWARANEEVGRGAGAGCGREGGV